MKKSRDDSVELYQARNQLQNTVWYTSTDTFGILLQTQLYTSTSGKVLQNPLL